MRIKEQNDPNYIASECFDITYEEETSAINLESTYPLTESEASSITPYTFKIRNICRNAANYQVNLEKLSGSTLSTNYVRTKFDEAGYKVQTSFVGAAIEAAMAQEIFDQLKNGTMTNAANLTDKNQLVEYCNWLISL